MFQAMHNCKLQRIITKNGSQFKNFEYIVVDGGSTDQTIEYLKSRENEIDYYISEKDYGIYDAINKGLSFARGEYVLLIHADDILKSDRQFNDIDPYPKP